MKIRHTLAFLAPFALIAACGGGDAPTTTAAAATTAAAEAATVPAVESTVAPVAETPAGAPAGGGALSAECAALWGEYVRTIEPIVADIDWTAADLTQVEQITPALEAAVAPLDAQFDSQGCNDLGAIDETLQQQLLEITSDEAPGAVPFVEFVLLASSEITSGM